MQAITVPHVPLHIPILSIPSQPTSLQSQTPPPFEATPYMVSTITAICKMLPHVSAINTKQIYESIDPLLVDVNDPDAIGFVFAEYTIAKNNIVRKGSFVKKPRKRASSFDNQLTLVFKWHSALAMRKKIYLVNIKVFINGSIQMTGLKHIDHGPQVAQKLIDGIQEMQRNHGASILKPEDLDKMCVNGYEIHLVNSDFKVNYEIKRNELIEIVNELYGIRWSFDPCRYQGVKFQYMFKGPNGPVDGICRCEKHCKEFKKAKLSTCRCITIAVFQSGYVIITGAQTYEQMDECYRFIRGILERHMDQIMKRSIEYLKKKNMIVVCPMEKEVKLRHSNIVTHSKSLPM
jgi:TATA-box binding protein (TBP) (component of TFIID and TFIIIB)